MNRIRCYLLALGICLLSVAGLRAVVADPGRFPGIYEKDTPVLKQSGGREEGAEDAAEDGEKEAEKTPADNPDIRVLLLSTGYQNEAHPLVSVSAGAGFVLESGTGREEIPAGQVLDIRPDDARFAGGLIRLRARDGGDLTVHSIERGCGQPSYQGTLELRPTAEGVILINELPVESYLCRVLPSEMPASYELEALKAQAVCARSYAYRQMESFGYPEYEAHVNDSTDYQVYGNSAAQETSNRAVEETAGQVLCFQGQIVTAYYYSTSCGRTTSLEAWGTPPDAQNQYLQSVEVGDGAGDYEKDLPWYRWEAKIPVQTLSNLAGLNLRQDLGMLTKVEVTKRGPGDVALEVTFTGEKGSAAVQTENKIRRAFGGSGYEIRGGGYGHGIGMSQNGANEMAKKGKSCQEILQLFYPGTEIISN